MFTCTKSEMRELIRGSSKWAALMTELGDEPQITECPDGLIIDGWLGIDKWAKVTALPDNLSKVSGALDISYSSDFKHLPDNLTVGGDLDLRRCTGLTQLPDNLTVDGSLYLQGCTGLTELPDNLTVGGDLDLRRCTGITMLPRSATIGGRVFWGDDWWG